ncbi:unannotated protein [freshwater metagenome]|uniref:Unannotated protein n=1 Tax=freshwater metagenome TaxID=449393 RepID=A0A6J6CJ57_9ZZZZ
MLRLCRESRSGEQGSMAPLGMGLALLSLTTTLVILAAGSFYLSERRLTSVAESTALYALSQSDVLSNQNLPRFAGEFLEMHPLKGLQQVSLIEATTQDGFTVRVRLCSLWRPIFEVYIFSEVGMICSEGLARRGR